MAGLEKSRLGNYQLVRLLGMGAFSEVYLGEHIHLRTLSAVRVLNASLTAEDVKHFLMEARVLARLSHPNILPTLDFGVEGDTPYIVMGYAPNGTLRQRHPRGTALPLTTVLSYTKPIAAALQYAHYQGVIHCDVKPENMLLSSRDELLLSDFGISTLAQSSRNQTIQEISGTIAYMAPEQLQGKPRQASDQYSLAVVIYEWLCGERPFHGTFTEQASQHMITPPPSLHDKVPGIPSDVETVVMTALSKDPQQRFKSVQAFATALEQAVGNWSTPAFSGPIRLSGKPTMPASGSFTPLQPSREPDLPAMLSVPSTYYSQNPYSPSAPPGLIPSEMALSRRRISRRKILIGLVGIVGLAAAEAVTAIRSSQAPQQGTPTPTLPKVVTYRGHSDEVNAVAWSPNGKLIASGSRDDTAKVWNSNTGITIYTSSSQHNWIFGVVWSPNGQQIASASADNTVQVWNATTGQHLLTYPGHSAAVYAVAWSPDGKHIASGSLDKTIQIWDVLSGNRLLTYKGHSAGVLAVAWSYDSSRIASAGADKTVQVWDAATGMSSQIYGNHSSGVTTVEWSPDGQYIASGSIDETVRVWDAATIGKTFTFTYAGHSDGVNSVAWSPDGKLIASGSADRTIQVWNTARTFSFTYRGHSNSVHAVAWSPIDRFIASASADKTVRVWRVM
jgi:WD40 repeat protein